MAAAAGLTVRLLPTTIPFAGLARQLDAAGEFPLAEIIPGVEISTDTTGGEVSVRFL